MNLIALFVLTLVSCYAQSLVGPVSMSGPISSIGPSAPASSFGTLTQYNSGACSGSASCGVPSVTLAAGDVAVITSAFSASQDAIITDVTGQNCVRDIAWTISTFAGSMDQCVILNASAISSATLTVNFSLSLTGGVVNVRRYQVLGGGTPAFDAVNSYNQASSSSITNVPLTISGTNAFAVEGLGNGCNSSSYVSSPWTDGTYLAVSGFTFCTADQINISSVTTPTWSGSGMYGTNGVAISFNPTASVQWGLMDSSGGTSGNNPTGATLASSTFGAPVSGVAFANWSYSSDNPSAITYIGSTGDGCGNAHHGLHGSPPRFLYGTGTTSGGLTYPNASTLGIKFAGGSTTTDLYMSMPLGGGVVLDLESPTVTFAINFCTTTLTTDTTNGDLHFWTTYDASNGTTNASLAANGSSLVIECAIGEGQCLNGLNAGVATTTPISTATWYSISTQLNTGWHLQSPSSPSSLSVGSNTISIVPCPFNVNMPYYIAGTGTPEFVQPVSTTCASNEASGTITVTVVGTHSAGYTLEAADPITIMNDSGTVIGMEYYEEAGTTNPKLSRLASAGGSAFIPVGRALYYDMWAMCFNTISPAVCPTYIRP